MIEALLGALALAAKSCIESVAAGEDPVKAAKDALRGVLAFVPAALQAWWNANEPGLVRLLTLHAEAEGVFGTDDARAKKGAELVASGDALPEAK